MKVCVHHGSSPSPGHRIQTLRPELKALNSWGLGTFLYVAAELLRGSHRVGFLAAKRSYAGFV